MALLESRALKVGIMQALSALLYNRSPSAPFCQFHPGTGYAGIEPRGEVKVNRALRQNTMATAQH